jgi:uncharacterized protein YgfB (UPF0149 family)
MSIQYNALEYAQQLEAAGVPKAQAEVHASMLGRVISDCVAVPADLQALRSDLTHQLVETETRLRAGIAETEARLSAKIDIGLERLSSRIDKLEDAMGYLKWMNALTLALLLGLIVKSSFA